MLKRNLRLLSPVSKKANTVSTEQFNLKFLPNELPNSRFGFIVSRKIDKRAVVRNRAKRVLRSVVEENIKNIKQGYDFLFVLKKNIIGRKRDDVEEDLLKTLKSKNLYV